jgi:periplasmic divalent cation tolerance protein
MAFKGLNKDLIVIYTTFPNIAEAIKTSRLLVERKLVACANIINGNTSIYEWNGDIKQESEVISLLKTTVYNFEKVREFIISNHSYDTPIIYSCRMDEVDGKFADWLNDALNSFILQ